MFSLSLLLRRSLGCNPSFPKLALIKGARQYILPPENGSPFLQTRGSKWVILKRKVQKRGFTVTQWMQKNAHIYVYPPNTGVSSVRGTIVKIWYNHSSTFTLIFVSVTDEEGSFGSTNIFYIAVGSACGVIFLIAFIVAVIYMRGTKPMRNNQRLRYFTKTYAQQPKTQVLNKTNKKYKDAGIYKNLCATTKDSST